MVKSMSLSNHVLNGKGCITALNHKIQNILNILDQITFHIAISGFLFKEAATQVANSGNEVPNATIVRPIMVSFIPSISAMCIAQSTIHCHPKTRPTKPKNTKIIDFPTDILFTVISSGKSLSFLAILKT
jgi:hypothetical protein